MSNHQKRLSVPNSWPVERKTATFTVKAGAGPHGESGVPLLILLRDVLGYVGNEKEARYALRQGSVSVNGGTVSDVQRPVGIFDILSFDEREEYYRVFPDEGGRLTLVPIDADAAESRLGKVVRKGTVSGGDVQLTLHDGTNVRVESDTEYSNKDSLVVDNETKAVVAHFPYEEGALAVVVDGQHAGETGTVDEIQVTMGSGSNTVRLASGEDTFETVEEYVVVIDENFTDDEDADGVDADEEADEVDADEEADEVDDGDDESDAEPAEESDNADDGGDDE
ncbi:30S ribosomal protein S4e [Halalkaliarchaeum desulfuricum]|uniref:Small ribosomal subunit protein eS4 n=1 Tax=Halalkaliarchaeum desulfuricum TaxID=2055893 RepID=A0A343TGW1_9EURY|nr:30S ribosomal protein S4e [Halalkaliarchaeum desulfuricum]AUX08333.1 30S ribosomal protein S4e [Halalkaliarchaeum desulfuricum]